MEEEESEKKVIGKETSSRVRGNGHKTNGQYEKAAQIILINTDNRHLP